MSVVKSLALGASILGSMVAPTLAGSMRSSHHIPDRPNHGMTATAPTSLVIAQPETAPLAAAPTVNAKAENLANLGGYQATQNYSGSFSQVFAATNSSTYLGYSTPAPVAAPVAYVAPTPAPAAVSVAAASSVATSGHTVDAFINFGNGPYSESQSLTTGSPQTWYQSPSVQAVFHGTPTAAQQSAFTSEVLQVAQSTYNQSGLNVSLTTDPNQNYAHTMSVVSGASYKGNSQAIGITDVGNDGFSFIDKFSLAKTPDELATAIGHNVAHELMHAFGIATHPDQTGTYLDAPSANWSTLTSASTTFSPQASQMLAAQNFLSGPGKEFTQGSLGLSGLELLTEHHPTFCQCPYCKEMRVLKASEGLAVNAAPVPEPTTVALWGVAAGTVIVARRRSNRRSKLGLVG